MQPEHPAPRWNDTESELFVRYGDVFVPERAAQIATIAALIPPRDGPCTVLDLCCGEGLLAEAILERHSHAVVYGFDGSTAMLERARTRLERFGDRFVAHPFELESSDWRDLVVSVHAVVSSLALHHLPDREKAELFRDMRRVLAPKGVLLIADLVMPAHALGRRLAAETWDAIVARQAAADPEALAAFERIQWNLFHAPLTAQGDRPARVYEQLRWLEQAGFVDIDVFWMQAGHCIFGGRKAG